MKQERNTDTHPGLFTVDTESESDLYFNLNLLCEVHLRYLCVMSNYIIYIADTINVIYDIRLQTIHGYSHLDRD